MTRVIVSGAIANKPLNGGNAWTRLSWVLGLHNLGFDVHLVEQIGRSTCVDTAGEVAAFEDSVNLAYFRTVTEQFGLSHRASLLYADGEQSHGLSYPELVDLAAATNLLVNIGGHLALEPIRRGVACAVYVDDDPGYTQFWHAMGQLGTRLAGHDFYFTVGENIGFPGCTIPSGDIDWRPIPPLVVLDQWPASFNGDLASFTTVASWRGAFGPVQYNGVGYGLKVHEFRKFIELPMRVPQHFEIALDIHPSEEQDLDLLDRHGWRLADPKAVTADPMAYRRYISSSGAEFSAAQGIYVQTECGWFSDRTACYLASGKPALVQDTGFSRTYPVGDGLVSFRTLDEAVAGANLIARDYGRHCRAARALAEAYFNSDAVLGRLLEVIGMAP